MDDRLRQLHRAAKTHGRSSPEDVAYIAAQVKAGVIPPQFVEAAADIGDRGALQLFNPGGWLAKIPVPLEPRPEFSDPDDQRAIDQGRANALQEYQRTTAYKMLYGRPGQRDAKLPLEEKSTPFDDVFRSLVQDVIEQYHLPTGLLAYWNLDCVKRIISMVWGIQTGRGHFLFRAASEAQRGALVIITVVEQWLAGQATIQELHNVAQPYCSKYEGISIGSRETLDYNIASSLCYLVQGIICTEYPCQSGNVSLSVISSEHLLPHMPNVAQDMMMTSIIIAESVANIIFTRKPYDRRTKFKELREYRRTVLQNLSDLMLNREWLRPHLEWVGDPETRRNPYMGIRINPDEELRGLERRARSGDPDAMSLWIRGKLRTGQVSEADIKLASGLGHPIAKQIVGIPESAPYKTLVFSWEPGSNNWIRWQIVDGTIRLNTNAIRKILEILFRDSRRISILQHMLLTTFERFREHWPKVFPQSSRKSKDIANAIGWQKAWNLNLAARQRAPQQVDNFLSSLDMALNATEAAIETPFAGGAAARGRQLVQRNAVRNCLEYAAHLAAVTGIDPDDDSDEADHQRKQQELAEYRWQANFIAEELLGIPHAS